MNLRKRTYISEGRRPPKGTPRVGTRVVFDPYVVSMAMYPHKEKFPRRGEEGTVTTVPLPGGKSHYLLGPGGGLLYVKWDKAGTMGVAPRDVKKVGATNEEKLYEAIMAITGKGLEPLKSGIRIQKNTEYYMGASSDPKHIIVTDVNDRFITYMTYPYKNKLRIDRKIGEDLIIQGVRTWIKNYGRRYPEDVANFNKLLAGKKGETVNPKDFQPVDVVAKVVGKHASDPEALWREAERYGGVGFNMKDKVFKISTTRGTLQRLKKNKNFEVVKVS